MNQNQLITLADTITAVRPDWTQAGILAQLRQLNANWPGTDAALAAHATAITANPQAHTPGAFNATPPGAPPRTTPGRNSGERCYICGRTQSACAQLFDYETAHDIDGPHRFESLAQADANKASNQWSEDDRVTVAESRSRRAQARAALAAHTSTPEDAA